MLNALWYRFHCEVRSVVYVTVVERGGAWQGNAHAPDGDMLSQWTCKSKGLNLLRCPQRRERSRLNQIHSENTAPPPICGTYQHQSHSWQPAMHILLSPAGCIPFLTGTLLDWSALLDILLGHRPLLSPARQRPLLSPARQWPLLIPAGYTIAHTGPCSALLDAGHCSQWLALLHVGILSALPRA